MATSDSAARDGRVHWWDILIVVVLGGVAGALITIAVAVAALLIAMKYGFRPGDAQQLVGALKLDFNANMVALVTSDLGFLLVTWWIAQRRSGAALAAFFPPVGWRLFALALLSGVALSVLLNGGNELLAHWKLVDFQDSDVERAIQPHTMPQIAVALGVIALFAPLAEEFFFRGLLLRWLSARGTALAVIVTALVFAAIHGQIFLHPGAQGLLFTAELFAAGVVLALWAIRTGSLRTSLATHAAYNATAVLFGVFFS